MACGSMECLGGGGDPDFSSEALLQSFLCAPHFFAAKSVVFSAFSWSRSRWWLGISRNAFYLLYGAPISIWVFSFYQLRTFLPRYDVMSGCKKSHSILLVVLCLLSKNFLRKGWYASLPNALIIPGEDLIIYGK